MLSSNNALRVLPRWLLWLHRPRHSADGTTADEFASVIPICLEVQYKQSDVDEWLHASDIYVSGSGVSTSLPQHEQVSVDEESFVHFSIFVSGASNSKGRF